MVESALEFLDVCEDEGYLDVVFSMKASNAQVAIQAYRLLAARLERARAGRARRYPFHVGVTEAGDGEDGRIKSAIGIGALLEDGHRRHDPRLAHRGPGEGGARSRARSRAALRGALGAAARRRARRSRARRSSTTRTRTRARATRSRRRARARRREPRARRARLGAGARGPARRGARARAIARARARGRLRGPAPRRRATRRDVARARRVRRGAARARRSRCRSRVRAESRLAVACADARRALVGRGRRADRATPSSPRSRAPRAARRAASSGSFAAPLARLPALVDRALAASRAAGLDDFAISVDAALAGARGARRSPRGCARAAPADVPIVLRHRATRSERRRGGAARTRAVDLGAPLCDGIGDARRRSAASAIARPRHSTSPIASSRARGCAPRGPSSSRARRAAARSSTSRRRPRASRRARATSSGSRSP